MRAKFINEELEIQNSDAESMAFEIAQVVDSTYNGDDVDYQPTEEDIEQIESIIKSSVKSGHLYIDEDDEDLSAFSDPKFILDNVHEEEINDIYISLVDAGFIDSGDFDEEDEPNDKFDLDQDIYDRNPDYDVDESVNESSNKDDYSEALFKMDKYMPDDPSLQNEYYEILDSGDVDALEEFLDNYADDNIYYYMPKGGTIRGLAEYMIGNE